MGGGNSKEEEERQRRQEAERELEAEQRIRRELEEKHRREQEAIEKQLKQQHDRDKRKALEQERERIRKEQEELKRQREAEIAEKERQKMLEMAKVPPNPLTDKPWAYQKTFDTLFEEKKVDELKQELTNQLDEKDNLTNIILLGPEKAGKSSYLNSIASAVEGRLADVSSAGDSLKSHTTKYIHYIPKGMNVNLHDCMGIERGTDEGFNVNNIMHLVNGHVPKDFKFNSSNSITEDDKDYIAHPKDEDKIHCVVYVIDAESLAATFPRELLSKIADLQKRLKEYDIPRLLILTKIDKVCEETSKDVGMIYRSVKIKDLVQKASEIFHLPIAYVHPLKNHGQDLELDHKISILVLMALKVACGFAEDYMKKKQIITRKAKADPLSGVIADLDVSVMLAKCGIFDTEGDKAFAEHRETIVKTARGLVVDTKPLMTGMASNEEQINKTAQKAVETMNKLAGEVNCGAGSLSTDQTETQVKLLYSVKDVALALSNLITAAHNATDKSVQDSAIPKLKEQFNVMVNTVAVFTKTVKSVKDATTSQVQDVEIADMTPKLGFALTQQSSDFGAGTTTKVPGFSGRVDATSYPSTVDAFHGESPSFRASHSLPPFESTNSSDRLDTDDQSVIAEQELIKAAQSIEAAATKLPQLEPRPKGADMTLSFEEYTVESARSITTATSSLIKASTAAQRELVAQGKMKATYLKTDDDGQWSQGLISAAKTVATATHNLCETAHMMLQGSPCKGRLIAAAREVGSSTTALLMACRVKANAGSRVMTNLQAAGNAVKEAMDALIQSAQQASEHEADRENVSINQSHFGGVSQRVAAQEEMLKLEKELEDARRRLAEVNKQANRYQKTDE